jgi:hypothetical protein
MAMKANPRISLFGIMLGLAICVLDQKAFPEPVPPCGPAVHSTQPPYAERDDPPAVAVWRDISLGPNECLGQAQGAMELVIALAGHFTHAGTLEELAARVGSISSMTAIQYWSVGDSKWRPLISKALAVEDPTNLKPRHDFTADEIVSGRTLYFAQDDTRSSGVNVYSLKARKLDPDRIVIEIVNITDIRFLLATMFEPRALFVLHFMERLHDHKWGYYGLSAARDGATEGKARSFINRAAAYHRFITGVPSDEQPALAP